MVILLLKEFSVECLEFLFYKGLFGFLSRKIVNIELVES